MSEQPPAFRRLAIGSLSVTGACLPLYVVRYHIGPLPTTLLETMIGITVAAYGLTLWSERRMPAARTAYDIPVLLLLVAGIGGIVAAPDHTRALGIYRAYILEAVVVFYVAVDLIRTRDELRLVLVVVGAGSCLMAIGQIVTFAMALAHHAVHIDAGPAFLNTSANSVALYLEPPLAFSVGLFLFPPSPRARWLALACAALFLGGIVLSLSRAAYLAVAALAVIAVLGIPNRRWRAWSVVALAVLLLVVLELPFISQRLDTFAHSVVLRSSIYGATLRMLFQRPILGAGISGFPIRVAPFRTPGEDIELYPHNLWLTTWSELGLLGLIALALIFFGLLWRGVRALPHATDLYKGVIWGAVGTMVLYLVHGMFDSPYWKNDLSVEFWLVAALQVVAIRGAVKLSRPASAPAAR